VSEERTASLLAPLAAEPAASATLFDLDGTLAPIVERPDEAAVPAAVRDLLAAIADRYALCGLITGRRAADARSIVGLDRVAVVGNHGLERLEPGSDEPVAIAEGIATAVADFVADFDPGELERAGLRLEDKGPIQALHWRGAADEEGAEREAEAIAGRAGDAGLRTHRGRKVVELRPAVDFDKGRGIESLLSGATVEHALYAGDDRTDVDGFRALGRLRDRGRLRSIVRIAVLAEETPPEVAEAADLTVEGPVGLVPLLETLAGDG
jgi:trehalose 6-phosphate phosphatase